MDFIEFTELSPGRWGPVPSAGDGEWRRYSCGHGAEEAQRVITRPSLTRVRPISWPMPSPLPSADPVDIKGNLKK